MERAAMGAGETTWPEEHLRRIDENHGGPFPRLLGDGKSIHLDDHHL